MADANLGYQEPDTIDKLLDAESLTVGADTVYRERIQISGSGAAEIAPVSATDGLLVNLGANNDVTVAGVSTSAKQDTIIGHLDGVEGLLTTIDADTGGILLAVDGIEALLTTIDTDTGSILSAVDGIEALLTTIDADTSNIATSVANIDTDTTTIIGHLDGVEGLLTTIDGDTGSLAELVKAEDTVHSTGDKGVMNLGVVNESFTALAAEGDYAPIQLDQYGRQFVYGDIQGLAAHDAAANGNPVLVGGQFDDTLPDSVDEGDAGRLRISANRNLYTTLRDAAGNERGLNVDANGEVGVSAIRSALPSGTNAIGKLAANSGVDIGDVDVTSIIPGTGATNLGKAEDAVHGSGDVGVMALGVGNVAQTTLAADGDYIPLATDVKGNVLVTGNLAHDAVDAGNPVKIGGKAVSTAPTDVAANDRVDAFFDLKGRQIVANKASTGTQTSVAGSATNVTLLAANTARLGATIYNDSTAILYLRLQATATTSNFTTKLFADDYYEVPAGYTGIIDGIWASATGNARITELT